MPTTEESTRAIGRAKAAIDNGFSRVGRTLAGDDRVAAWLHVAAGRAVSLCDAILLLCKEHHVAEAAALVRSVIQLAADVRWIAGGPGAERLSELETQGRERDWGSLWSSERLRRRWTEGGAAEGEASLWLERAARLCAGHLAGGSSTLPWAHAVGPVPLRLSAEETLGATAAAMAELVAALDVRWTGFFAP